MGHKGTRERATNFRLSCKVRLHNGGRSNSSQLAASAAAEAVAVCAEPASSKHGDTCGAEECKQASKQQSWGQMWCSRGQAGKPAARHCDKCGAEEGKQASQQQAWRHRWCRRGQAGKPSAIMRTSVVQKRANTAAIMRTDVVQKRASRQASSNHEDKMWCRRMQAGKPSASMGTTVLQKNANRQASSKAL